MFQKQKQHLPRPERGGGRVARPFLGAELGKLLQDTKRLDKAEPLMRRALAICVRSLGAAHSTRQTAQENYRQLLAAMGRSKTEIDAAVRQVVDGTPEPK